MTSQRKQKIASELSVVMTRIARTIALSFSQSYHQMPPAQIFAVLLLSEQPICHFSDIVRQLRVSAPTATGIIDRLEKQGFVERRHDTEDRRAVNVALTPAGRRLEAKIRRGVEQRWNMILDVLTIEESETYLKIVKKIYEKL